MGEVYRAQDLRLMRAVAIKRLAPQLSADPAYHTRFLKEGQRASALNNPHIAGIYDVLEENSELYLVMEYIEGATLRQRLARPLGIPEFLDIGIQCADALQAAHEKGIVHGDVKPENIMLTSGGGQVKMLDFGVARRLVGPDSGPETVSLVTMVDTISGTPAYMAPEAMLAKPVDGRADIFSLGVVFYEMLGGQNPFRTDTFLGTSARVLHETPPPIGIANPSVPPELERLVTRMIAKNPVDRYPSAAELSAELRQLAAEGIEPLRWPRLRVWRRRYQAWAAGVIALAALAVLLRFAMNAGLFNHSLKRTPPAPPAVQQLAVLPFETIGGDSRLNAFADGVADTLTGKLTQLTARPSLQVYPASEVRAHDVTTVDEAQKEFGVNLVLTGSLEASGQLVRVTTVLIDAKSRRQVNSATITASMADAFAVEDQVVTSSLRMLGIEPQEKELAALTEHGTEQSAAYDDYLEGIGYARQFQKPENLQLAAASFNRALKKDQKYGLAYAGLGQVYWHEYEQTRDREWVDRSRAACTKAAILGNGGAEAHTCLGLLDNGTGNYEAAAREFQQALKIEPTSDRGYVGLAQAEEQLGKMAQAEKTFQQAIALRPNYGPAYNWLGNFYFNRGRYQDAARMYRAMVDLNPDASLGYANLGGAYLMEGRYADSIEPLKTSIAIRPSSAGYSNLGTAYYGLGRYADAARTYEEAVKSDPRHYDLWGNLGDAYYWAPGERTKAPAAYQKAVTLAREQLAVNPKDHLLLSYVATYQAMLGDRSAALASIEEAFRPAPTDPELMFNAALVYIQVGDHARALDWLAKAVAAGYPAAGLRDTPNFSSLQTDARFQKILQTR
jgi:tetratricopeptide (TPR) repeat protein/TolB-like protein